MHITTRERRHDPLAFSDLLAIKRIIAETDMFPPKILDAMAAPFLNGHGSEESWLVVDNGEPVAVAHYAPERMTEGTWNLLLIAVRPDHQGRGAGSALQRHVEQELTARGQRVLLVETSSLPAFERTHRFYKSLGYIEEARIRDFYEAGNSKVVFWKHLGFRIRAASAADVATLQAVELDAARVFDVDQATRFCIDLPARDEAEHASARESGLALVGGIDGASAGFILSVLKDGHAHLLELAVARPHQGRGLGTRLILAFEAWAVAEGLSEATLTTFRDVTWNAPFYERLQYEAFEPEDDRPELLELIADEKRAGFHLAPRVAMRKCLS